MAWEGEFLTAHDLFSTQHLFDFRILRTRIHARIAHAARTACTRARNTQELMHPWSISGIRGPSRAEQELQSPCRKRQPQAPTASAKPQASTANAVTHGGSAQHARREAGTHCKLDAHRRRSNGL